ncbi:3-phosphoshikimate 1-carboxyvinyltransferase [Solilutibacter silvestris]|uniref:3-phosphoshikimate 1-carboxyvinyltransferase n=1 Tax=Solilutibacter silvestris TaxID=1645665 RepID=A0A2K1PYH8_9GAMM|nr:3-phosphoshikimate 1-carboxyvinyltransferase [Lysobacter silvestris]PNS07845.1 aroA: 3-phosphoshikimate 1-carboxyvinyltransferase [Lysobacter silvestris]
MSAWIASKGQPLHGRLAIPGDKSVSHRAIMLAALAEGRSHIHGFLEGGDTRATAAIFQQLGVRIEAPEPSLRIVDGVGLHGLKASASDLDCGNAGTAMRLLSGLFAAQAFASTLVGDESLTKRPMRRVIEPLRMMGAQIEAAEGDVPPLRVSPASTLRGIDYALPVASAQVKSALLLAGLYADGTTRITEPHPTRDYSERMLQAFGWPIRFGEGWAEVEGGHRLIATDIHVPADFSSAAFALVAACVIPGSDLVLQQVGMNPRRTGLLRVLAMMGADIRADDAKGNDGEPVADLYVRATTLRGIDVPVDCVPDMIDEFPVLFIAAALADGITRVRGAAELRVKESDRIAAMANGLRALGIRVDETPDGADIHGGSLHGGVIESHGDHRIAMAFAVAAQRASADVEIRDTANVATSYPGFAASTRSIGFDLRGD